MIYIKEFLTVDAANAAGTVGLNSPHVDLVVEKSATNIYKGSADIFKCGFDENGKIINIIEPRNLGDIAYWDGGAVKFIPYNQ